MPDSLGAPIGNEPFFGSPDPNQPVNNDPVNNSPDSLANGFLNNVDPADRPVVERYIKDWDSGVTRRFQAIHDQYKPYKDLGYEPDAIRQAISVVQALNNDPVQFYTWLKDSLGESVPDFQPPNQPNQEPEIPDWADGLPPQFVQMFQAQQQMIEQMSQGFSGFMEQQQQTAQDAELDNLLSSLQQKHGDFDEDFVIAKMLKGMTPDDAVNAYKQLAGGGSQQPNRQPAPKVLGGYGSVPTPGNKNLGELSRNETTKLVQQMLAAGQQ